MRALFLIFLAVFPVLLGGQSIASPATVPMPKDPAEILAKAGENYGLESSGVKPWYLKVSFKTFDEQGSSKNSGTYEEWWVGPKKNKRVFTSKDFTQTEYVTESGTYRTGAAYSAPEIEGLLRPRLLSPLPAPADYADAILERNKKNFDKVGLQCVTLARKMRYVSSAPTGLFPTYCFDEDQPLLRWSGSFGQWNTTYNHYGKFQNKYIAVDIATTSDTGTPVLSAHVEVLKALSPVADAEFVPPAEAIMLPSGEPVVIDTKLKQYPVVKKVAPQYPEAARQSRIEGVVKVQVVIGEDGHIHYMNLLSAPDPTLAISAMIAVRKWEYKPYLLNGRPVQASTVINVVFKLR